MKLLLYCTKAKPQLFSGNSIYNQEKIFSLVKGNNQEQYEKLETLKCLNNLTELNGKIVAECDFECEHLYNAYDIYDDNALHYFDTDTLKEKELIEKSCVSNLELEKYFGKSNGYAIHIKNLHIFDEPRELSDYEDEWEYPLENAPQNMRHCYSTLYSNIDADIPIRTDSYILISIRPEWLCKILNKEKKIEVRKKVLKEMLK